MICPKCKSPMIVLELEGVETDYCLDCKGIWLDDGELDALLDDSNQKDSLLNSIKPNNSTTEKKIKCPICNSKMEKVNIGKDTPVLLDRCKHQHGFWFDDGEVFEVISTGSVDKNNKIIKILSDMYKNEININVKEEK